jgi:hypothetical protein
VSRAGFDQLEAAIAPVRLALLAHPIYADLATPRALRIFMQHHVFAVWDFMSLLKALQRTVCGAGAAWTPPRLSLGARLINEIVLAEESDEDGAGGYASHFELYRRAMRHCGADTAQIDSLVEQLSTGQTLVVALAKAPLPAAAQRFVEHTFDVIATGDPVRIAAAFTFGREDLLPDVFAQIVDRLAAADPGLATFKYYLLRHIELDGDHHGPMAQRLIECLCGDDPSRWLAATAAAQAALEARLAFWDAIHSAVGAGHVAKLDA